MGRTPSLGAGRSIGGGDPQELAGSNEAEIRDQRSAIGDSRSLVPHHRPTDREGGALPAKPRPSPEGSRGWRGRFSPHPPNAFIDGELLIEQDGFDRMTQRLIFRAEFFRDDDLYVGLAPELGVSSFGESLNEAKLSLKEAAEAFIEECEAMGALDEVLQEAGFRMQGNLWAPRQPLP